MAKWVCRLQSSAARTGGAPASGAMGFLQVSMITLITAHTSSHPLKLLLRLLTIIHRFISTQNADWNAGQYIPTDPFCSHIIINYLDAALRENLGSEGFVCVRVCACVCVCVCVCVCWWSGFNSGIIQMIRDGCWGGGYNGWWSSFMPCSI